MTKPIKKLKNFFKKDKVGIQVYSFIKTYVVVFLGIVLAADATGQDCLDLTFLLNTAKISLVAVTRNIYKIITE